LPPEEYSEPAGGDPLPVTAFDEVWAYLVRDREAALTEGLPISDLGYFGAEVDSYGKLTNVPNPGNIPPFGGRVHLVVKCDSYSLTHFVLKNDSPERRELIADLVKETRNFDGLQIDFENIPSRDREQFFSFLAELRARLGDTFFSVALRARTRALDNDVHDYRRISPLVDRILVMAYDEHWGGSEPGPVASMEWCRNVAAYALSVIGRGKLIMGLPFYGRAWIDPSPAAAYTYPQIESLLRKNQVQEIRREDEIPSFEYETPVTVKGYYEDAVSLGARLRMYNDMKVRAVGFWRLGQENTAVWDLLRLDTR
jgi:spore germination protein YaaH